MNVPFMYNFRSLYRTNSLYDFLKFNISHFTPQVKLLSVEKGTWNFRNRKCDVERNQKNSHFRKTLNSSYNFRENNTEVLLTSKRLKMPKDDRTDKNFLAQLRIHFQRSESTLDSLESVFNAFRGKPSLGAPVLLHFTMYISICSPSPFAWKCLLSPFSWEAK